MSSLAFAQKLECERIINFTTENMDSLSKWWLSEVLFDGRKCQLINGDIASGATNLKLGIPTSSNFNATGPFARLKNDSLKQ